MSIQGTDIDITEPSNAKILKAYSDGGKPALFSENFEYFDAHDEIIKIYSQFKVAPDVYRTVLTEKIDQLYEELIKDKPVNFDSLDTLEQKATVNVDSKLKNFNEKKLPPGYPFKNKEVSPEQMADIMERLEKIKATCSGVVKSNLKDHEVIANCLRSPNPLNAFLMRDTSGDDEALLQRAFQAIVKNSDLNKKDENGKTPLEVALLNGNTKYALKLIEAGADIKQIDFNQENLQGKKLSEVVVLKGPKELMEKMLEAGVKLTLVDELALMNDLYLSRALSKEARDLISDDEQYLALCAEVTSRRYEIFSERQKGAAHKEAAFNQIVRNTNFAPRGLLETYMARRLEENDIEAFSEYQGQKKIDVLFDLAKKIVTNPNDEASIEKLAQLIDKYYPEEILEAVLPTFNEYLENKNEDNYLNTEQKKAKEQGMKEDDENFPKESPEDKHQRRTNDFCGQLIFMIESNIMAKGVDTKEKGDLAKVFIKVRAKRSPGLAEKMDKVRKEKGEDYTPPKLNKGHKAGTIERIEARMDKIKNLAYINGLIAEAKKNETTLLGVREQNLKKNEEFKLNNII
ncbi:MAG: hypothetical protein AB7V32_09855, partial [Candidatus Berkiella sp.]